MIRIDIEGLDAAGKTTLVNYLVDNLKQTFPNLRVLKLSEAGFEQIPLCVTLKKLALDTASPVNDLLTAELLFAAQRIETQQWLNDHQNSYDVAISDRGFYSHLAYGMASDGMGQSINRLFNLVCEPYATRVFINLDKPKVIYLKIDPAVAKERMVSRAYI